VIGGPKGAGGNGPKVAVCAVLKQDGYGLGAARLAKRLVGTGVEMIAVYTLDEARAIADAVGSTPILVLMPVPGIDRMDPVYRHVTSGRIHLTLHSEDQLKQITEMTTRIGTTLPVHVQVDTGLSRGGAMPEQAHALVQKMLATPRVKLAGLMTHFSSPCCDAEFTREQAKLFRDFVEGIKPVLKAAVAAAGSGKNAGGVVAPHDLMLHAANSCAMFRARNYHGTMVRVGPASSLSLPRPRCGWSRRCAGPARWRTSARSRRDGRWATAVRGGPRGGPTGRRPGSRWCRSGMPMGIRDRWAASRVAGRDGSDSPGAAGSAGRAASPKRVSSRRGPWVASRRRSTPPRSPPCSRRWSAA
jgi:hypothetical protein